MSVTPSFGFAAGADSEFQPGVGGGGEIFRNKSKEKGSKLQKKGTKLKKKEQNSRKKEQTSRKKVQNSLRCRLRGKGGAVAPLVEDVCFY